MGYAGNGSGSPIARTETEFYPHLGRTFDPVVAASTCRVLIDVCCIDAEDKDCPQVIVKVEKIIGEPPTLLGCSIREENGHPAAVISRHGNIIGYLGVKSIEFKKQPETVR